MIGLINSPIDLLKSIFDILSIAFELLNALIQSSKFYESPKSYLSLFAECIENMLDVTINSLTLENLKEFAKTLIYIPKKSLQAISILINNPPTEEDIPSGAIGYYLGYSIGFVVSEVVTFFATGGVGTIGKALKTTLKSYQSIVKGFVKTTQKVLVFSLDTLLKLIKKLIQLSKNIPQYLKEFRQLIDEFVAGLKAEIILIDNVSYSIVDLISAFGHSFFTVAKSRLWKQLHKLGLNVVKKEGLFSFVYHGIEIKRDVNQTEAKEFLSELFLFTKGKSDDAIKKYLDELEEFQRKSTLRKKALTKFLAQLSETNLDELIEHIFAGHLRSTRVGRGSRAIKKAFHKRYS